MNTRKKFPPHSPLNPIRIIMVRTTYTSNIGAAARAMRVMGLYDLYLVEPKHFPSQEATALASGAVDVLEHATVVPNLAAALQGCQCAYATTAHPSKEISQLYTAEEAAMQTLADLQTSTQAIAFVFGNERTGLTEEEIQQCQRLMTIPSENRHNSLNIGAAIQIVSYELFKAKNKAESSHQINIQ